jgi:putative membrane protein
MKYETMLPLAAALALTFAAGCERRSEDTSGTARTTSATPSQMDDLARDASVSATGTSEGLGTSDRSGTMGTTERAAPSDTTGATGTTATTGAKVEQPLAKHDKEFITEAMNDSMAEIALGTTASMKATLPETKSLADRMVSDHNKASEELRALAAKKGVAPPAEMEKAAKNEQDKLAKMTGKKVDKEYADRLIKDEEKDLKAFQKAAKDAKDPDVKSWAAKMIPTIEDHVKSAKQIESKIK